MSSPSDITKLLVAWSDGDEMALGELMPLVERELHRMASHYMRGENNGHILQTTALVNEAYLRLVDQKNVRWQNRAQFFAIASIIMRRILSNEARDRHRQKRGGHATPVSLSEVITLSFEKSEELIALDEALTKLAEIDPRKARVVELRYFGGLSVKETAHVMDLSEITVLRDWQMARAWLARELGNGS